MWNKNKKIQKSKNTCPRSGGNLEVMGLLLGKVDANVMVVMDSFALPVEGTETRVNAQAQGYEYMTAYIEAAKQVGFEQCQIL
jgi:COP9 signalosome complex subunit 5